MNNYNKITLENGLRIITVPMASTETATVLVLVGTGSKYETKKISGISHFLEHMFFKGTKKRPNTLAIAETLDRIGGEYNAFTSQEYTGYWAKVKASHLDIALDWVSDIFLNSELRAEDIEKERGVILEELNMYLDTPVSYIGELWVELLYGNQPAGWAVIGNKQAIKSFKKAQFINYFNKHYSAKNTLVVIAGKIDSEAIIEKIKKHFSSINFVKPQEKIKVKEKQTKPQSLIHFKKTDQTHLYLGARAYDLFHPDRYALGILSTILGGYMSSRIWQAVRWQEGLSYYVSTGSSLDTDCGYLATRAGVDNKRVLRAIEIILNEYKKIRDNKVSPDELNKAKENIKGSTALEMESSDAQASFYASQELLAQKIETLEQKFQKIDAVTAEDIQKVAKDIFQPKKLNLALIGSFKNKKPFDKLINSIL